MTGQEIRTHNDLITFLECKLGKDYECDGFEILMGGGGKYKGHALTITFKVNNYLLVSIVGELDLLKEIEPILIEIMGTRPICTYDIYTKVIGEDKIGVTMEWDVKKPDERIKEIVNGRAYSSDTVIKNIVLVDRDINKYLETEDEKAEVLASARIYGIDPGCLKDSDSVKNLDEIELYHLIDFLGGVIWCARHATKRDPNPPSLLEEQYAIEFCVYQSKKFGVDDINEPSFNKHIKSTEKYWAWFRFYDNHFKKVLTNEQQAAYQKAKKVGKDVSKFMPIGSWKETLK